MNTRQVKTDTVHEFSDVYTASRWLAKNYQWKFGLALQQLRQFGSVRVNYDVVVAVTQ